MTNNSLIRLLSGLSRKEMTRFNEFAQSPYFNKHKDVRNLVGYLSEIYPDFSEKKCRREVVSKRLFPNEVLKYQQLAIVFTYSLRLLELFFKIEMAKSDGLFDENTLYLRFLRHHNFPSFFEKSLGEKSATDAKSRSLSASAEPASRQDARFFHQQYKLAAEKDACSTLLDRHDLNFIAAKQRWLDAFYLTEKLRDACEVLQRSNLFKVAYEDPMLEKSVQELSENLPHYAEFAPVRVYFNLYRLLKNNDYGRYRQTVEVVQTFEAQLSKDELQNIYNHLQNFCIIQINRGNQSFLNELFSTYQSQLEKELIFIEGNLPEWHYKNIVTTGLRLDMCDWVYTFINDYRHRLPSDVAGNAYSYNLAAYFHHIGRYEQVLDLLLKVEYTDFRYSLDAKSMLLRTYFDLEEEEALFSLTEAFKQFLKRSKTLSEFQKKGYYALLKFTRQASKLKTTKGLIKNERWQAAFSKLKTDIAAAETIFNQSWLEGKVKEMEG